MKKLYDHYGVSSDLSDLRIYCMFSLAFASFLRFNELVNIRFAELTFFDSHVQIFIPKSKTDIFRQWNKLQEQAKKHVLLFVLKIILEFPRLQTRKNSYLEHYSIKNVDKIGLDKSKFGLHSLRIAGATSAANNSVADRLF